MVFIQGLISDVIEKSVNVEENCNKSSKSYNLYRILDTSGVDMVSLKSKQAQSSLHTSGYWHKNIKQFIVTGLTIFKLGLVHIKKWTLR